jgi:hypothetical protein
MASLTDYAENALVDHVFRAETLTLPAAWHVGLFTAAPSDAGGGTEVSGGSYARVAVTRALADWSGTQAPASTTASTGTGGRTSNNAAVTFTTPTGSWGTVTHWGLFDAATAGNLWFHAALTASQVINSGDPVEFAADALGVTWA